MKLDTNTLHAWTFTHLIPGTFKRNKRDFAHHNYPILAPLPDKRTKTQPLQVSPTSGPYIYFIVDRHNEVAYVGKTEESKVLTRWMRPGTGGPADYYWTHSTKTGGSVFNIANGIQSGEGPFQLRYADLSMLLLEYTERFRIDTTQPTKVLLDIMESKLIALYHPKWNNRI